MARCGMRGSLEATFISTHPESQCGRITVYPRDGHYESTVRVVGVDEFVKCMYNDGVDNTETARYIVGVSDTLPVSHGVGDSRYEIEKCGSANVVREKRGEAERGGLISLVFVRVGLGSG